MALAALEALWQSSGLPSEALANVKLTGSDPMLPSSFVLGTAAQVSIAASALAASEVCFLRNGFRQPVVVDMRHAAVEFRSERYFRLNGGSAPELWDKLAGVYRCGDDRWVRLHTNFPHHREGLLALLQCTADRQAIERSLRHWKAEEFEQAAAEANLVVAAMRSFDEWDAHPQGMALAQLPLLSITKLGDAPVRRLPPSERPLAGVKVLDLTRIVAGPVCGRTLAAHGADVLLVTSPHLPSVEPLVIDTGRGKRSCHLDLRFEPGRSTFRTLLAAADVMVQAYRPGGLDTLGFGPTEAARIRPGIIYVSLSAYGHLGPWTGRRGFDSLVQTATGFNDAEARAAGSDKPQPLPAQVLDHAGGYLMAYGTLCALTRRTTEGGSWHVQVSLARVGHWLRQLGRIEDGLACSDLQFEDIQDLLEEKDSGFGRLLAVRHSGSLAVTPPSWTQPAVPLGSHAATWTAQKNC